MKCDMVIFWDHCSPFDKRCVQFCCGVTPSNTKSTLNNKKQVEGMRALSYSRHLAESAQDNRLAD